MISRQLALGGALVIAAIGLGATLSGILGMQLVRVAIAALIIAVLGSVALVRPAWGTVLTLVFLVLLGLLRRLLIPLLGWSGYDPLLLVGPILSMVLVCRLILVPRRPLTDWVSRAVLGLLALSVLEAFNPKGGGPIAGAVGLLFVAAPLLWFFVGRELSERRALDLVVWGTIAMALAVAAYGLAQTYIGLLPWDRAWLASIGYASLSVSGVIRAFGTFASASEYAYFLGAGLVVAAGAALHGRLWALLPVPVLAVALFLESSRGIVVLVVLAVIVMAGLRTRSNVMALLVWFIVGGAVVGGWAMFGGSAQTAAIQSGDPLAVHQVSGLADPLNPDTSTLQGHWQSIVDGTVYAIQNPLGAGTSSSNLAYSKLGGVGVGTEVDITDELVDIGIVGGLLFAVLIAAIMFNVVRTYFRTNDTALLCVAGVLVMSLGHWLTGGYYAMAPLVWFLAGWACQQWAATSLVTAQPVLSHPTFRPQYIGSVES